MRKINQQKMFEDIGRWQQSGLTQKAWCEQNKVAYSSFHYWYRLFRNEQTGNKQTNRDGFVQLLVQNPLSVNPWCELVVGDGRKIFFHQPIAAEFIRSLLQ